MKIIAEKTLAAIRKHDALLWAIGDALVKECPTGKLTNVVICMEANGCGYNEDRLRVLRRVAAAFPASQRYTNLSFSVHQEAGTPEMLRALVDGAPAGTRISKKWVRQFMKYWRKREKLAARAK